MKTNKKESLKVKRNHDKIQIKEMKNMYAITFDLNQEMLQKTYGKENFNNAYADIKRELAQHGFERQQGSVYFGTEEKSVVEIIIAVQEVSEKLKWLAPSVTDIRLLEIEEFNDLMPAIEKGAR